MLIEPMTDIKKLAIALEVRMLEIDETTTDSADAYADLWDAILDEVRVFLPEFMTGEG